MRSFTCAARSVWVGEGCTLITTVGSSAPAGEKPRGPTPREIVNTLNANLLKAMDDADVKRRIANEAAAASQGTPEDFAAYLKGELAKNAKMIKDAKLKRD